MRKLLSELFSISFIKSFYINFSALPFCQAIRLPIIVSRHVKIDGRVLKNSIELTGKVQPASILFGFGGSRNFSSVRSKRSYLKLSGSSKLIFKGAARFAPHFTLILKNATMEVGMGFSCNNGCLFLCNQEISFGDDCLLGRDIEIRDSDGHTVCGITQQGIFEKDNRKAVKIGNHVWICSKVTILKGVEIGNDCVVAHSSVCTKAFHGDCKLIAGYPAKIIRDNISWRK